MSIKTKLLLVILFPTLLICLALLLLISSKATRELSKDNIDKMSYQLQAYSAALSVDLNHAQDDVNAIARYLEEAYLPQYMKLDAHQKQNQGTLLTEELKDYVRTLSATHKDLDYFVYYISPSYEMPENFGFGDYSGDSRPDPMPELSFSYFTTNILSADKAWYFDAINKGGPGWYGPLVKYAGVSNRELMVYSTPVYYNNQVIAVIGVDYPIAKLRQFISQIKYYDTGYAALMNDHMEFLAHPSIVTGYSISELYNDNYQFIEDTLRANSSGSVSYVWTDQRQKSLAFVTLSNGWKLILTAYMDEVMAPAISLKLQMILMLAITLLLTGLMAYLASHWITQPLIRLSREMKAIVSTEGTNEFSYKVISRRDQAGQLAQKLSSYYQKYLSVSGELKFLTNHLSLEIENRNLNLLETNLLLAEKQAQVKKQQETLQAQNQQLEASIQTLFKTQNLLIAEEKLATFSEIIHGIALEIEPPIDQNFMLATELDTSFSRLTRLILRSEYSRQAFISTYENAQLKNRKLIGNLLFSKDIIDYIKDLTAAKSFRQLSIIELYDYLEKAKAYLDNVPLSYPPIVHMQTGPMIFLELEATKFLHLVSSLLIHIATGTQLKHYGLHMSIHPKVVSHKLVLKISDNAYGTLDAESFCQRDVLDEHPNIYMGLSMIQILIRESFNGTLEVVQKSGEPGTHYILSFPNVLYEPATEELDE